MENLLEYLKNKEKRNFIIIFFVICSIVSYIVFFDFGKTTQITDEAFKEYEDTSRILYRVIQDMDEGNKEFIFSLDGVKYICDENECKVYLDNKRNEYIGKMDFFSEDLKLQRSYFQTILFIIFKIMISIVVSMYLTTVICLLYDKFKIV